MKIINFINQFPDEASCVEFIKHARLQQGIICKRCSHSQNYWLENKKSFQCASCKFRSGAVMENSNLPVKTCMLAMTFIFSYQERVQCYRTSEAIDNVAI